MISEQLDKLGQIKLKLIMNFFAQISLSHMKFHIWPGPKMHYLHWIIVIMMSINRGVKLTILGAKWRLQLFFQPPEG